MKDSVHQAYKSFTSKIILCSYQKAGLTRLSLKKYAARFLGG